MANARHDWLWKMLLEVVLIGVAVFLGMAADQWRTDRQHREQARAALHRFKAEIETNLAAVNKVQGYHQDMRTAIAAYLDPKTRAATTVELAGIRPVVFEHTAWDLAIATQSLADLDSEVAFDLAKIYGLQEMHAGLTAGMMQAMYVRPPSEDSTRFLHTLKLYYDDIIFHEPALVEMYGQILPKIDRALKD